jgi:hypothetical protein
MKFLTIINQKCNTFQHGKSGLEGVFASFLHEPETVSACSTVHFLEGRVVK